MQSKTGWLGASQRRRPEFGKIFQSEVLEIWLKLSQNARRNIRAEMDLVIS